MMNQVEIIRAIETHKALLELDSCAIDFIKAANEYKLGEHGIVNALNLLEPCSRLYAKTAYAILVIMKVDAGYISKCMTISGVPKSNDVWLIDALDKFIERWSSVDMSISGCTQLDLSDIGRWVAEVYSYLLSYIDQ